MTKKDERQRSVTGEPADETISVAATNKTCATCGHAWTEYTVIPVTEDHLLMLRQGVLDPNVLLAAHELDDPKKAATLVERAAKRITVTDEKTGKSRQLSPLETAKHLRDRERVAVE